MVPRARLELATHGFSNILSLEHKRIQIRIKPKFDKNIKKLFALTGKQR